MDFVKSLLKTVHFSVFDLTTLSVYVTKPFEYASTFCFIALLCAISTFTLFSCEQEIIELEALEKSSAQFTSKIYTTPSGPGETVLGSEMANPYEISNIRAANSILNGREGGKIDPTHYYLKFLPESASQITALEEYADSNGYEFEIQPIHFEVVYEGDEGYFPLPPGEEGIVPEYAAIKASDFDNGNIPNVPYEVIHVMHISKYETLLTFTAFVISGNEKYYEAVDGFCHPDCPSWPLCLDEPEYTCVPPLGASTKSVDPTSTEGREKFPSYILDDKIGIDGEFSPLRECTLIINEMPDCPDNCTPVLGPYEFEPDACIWECQCEDVDDNDPYPGLVEQCDCLVYEDERKPGGRVILEDTQLGDEGVQNVKILSTRRHWGFIYKDTDTDQNGCWKINKRYNNKNAKVKVVFRDRENDRLIIRSWRGWRFWNALIKPVKHKFKLTKNDRIWNNLCLRIEDTDDEQSQAEEAFVAATVNNAAHDFYGFENLPKIDEINFLIHTQNPSWQAAPMFGFTDRFNINTPGEFSAMVSDIFGLDPALGDFLNSSSKPDIFIPFQRRDDPVNNLADPFYGSDDIKVLVYHETAHAFQAAFLGPVWWSDYRAYIIAANFHNSECTPYGDQNLGGHGRAEITEGMAVAFSLYYADIQFEGSHSNLDLPAAEDEIRRSRFINGAEQADFWRESVCGRFIPEGLFFDLFDDNNVFPTPLQLPEIEEKMRIITLNADQVSGLHLEHQLRSLNMFTFTMEQFKENLRTQAQSLGISDNDFNNLFSAYGH